MTSLKLNGSVSLPVRHIVHKENKNLHSASASRHRHHKKVSLTEAGRLREQRGKTVVRGRRVDRGAS